MSEQNVSTIEAVTVELSAAQQRALRVLALRTSKVSASEMADNLIAQVIRGRFKAMIEAEAQKLGVLYDMASANDFKQAMSRAEFIAAKRRESAELLNEL